MLNRTGNQEHSRTSKRARTLPLLAFCIVFASLLVMATGCVNATTGKSASGSSPAGANAANVNDFKYKSLFDASEGDIVTFGSYEQDGNASNGAEPIDWVVMQKRGSRVQLVSKDLLDCQPYRDGNPLSTWMESTLRPWLNGTFLDKAFSTEERALIRKQVATYPGSAYHGNILPCTDMEFDYVEVPYDRDTAHAINAACGGDATPTKYAKSLASSTTKDEWWLSETGFEHSALVEGPGVAAEQKPGGTRAANNPYYVRPTLWVSLPAEYIDGVDNEGCYSVYAELIEYAPDAQYLVDDIDGDGVVELVMLVKDNGIYSLNVYGYEVGELVYYGGIDFGQPLVKFASLPDENGLRIYLQDGTNEIIQLVPASGAAAPSINVLPGSSSQSSNAREISLSSCSDTSPLSAVIAGSGSGTTSNTDTGSQLPQGYDSTKIDFDSTETRHDLNLFLSNFSEKGPDFAYTPEACTDGYMCNFAVEHIKYNFPDAMEDAGGMGVRNSAGTLCDTRTEFEIFQRYPTIFLKHDFSEGNVTGQCVYQDGYVYYPHPADTAPSGIVYVTGTRDRADGKVDVAFDVYGGAIDYTVTDESYYSCSAEELMSRLGVSGPSRSGTAVVEPWDDGSVAPFKLYEFQQNSK